MKELGEKIEEASLVHKILTSLPDSFNPKVSSIKELNDIKDFDFDQLIGTFNAFEIRIVNINPPLEKHHLKQIRMRILSMMKLKQNL
jgi:hypothetical protein